MRPRYLLDTNICIYVAKHNPPQVRRRFESLSARDLAMSVVTFGELGFGVQRSQHPELARQRLDRLAQTIEVMGLPKEAGTHYGQIRADLERRGCPIGANDLWIAAHARAEGWTLVTNNLREFERVPELRVENWVNAA